MNHLDEGTIHAWLDGALDADQSRDIERHVVECPACRDAVLEARGLIAGASRILTALDDLPAGVTPRRAEAPRRQWRAAPWVTGIAAAMILAVGLTTWNRSAAFYGVDRVPSQPVSVQREQSAPATIATEATPLATSLATPPVADSAGNQASPSQTVAAPRRAERPETMDASARARTETRTIEPIQAKRAAAGGAPAGASLEKVEDKAAAANAVNPIPIDSVSRRMKQRELRMDEAVVTAREAAPAPAIIPRMPVAQVSDVERSVGCYRLPVSIVERVSSDAKAVAARGRAAAPAPSAAAAPARVSGFASVSQLLRLDPDSAPNRFAHIVRAASSDSTVSTAMGTWNPMSGDSVRVDLRSAGLGIFVFATRDKETCPRSP